MGRPCPPRACSQDSGARLGGCSRSSPVSSPPLFMFLRNSSQTEGWKEGSEEKRADTMVRPVDIMWIPINSSLSSGPVVS